MSSNRREFLKQGMILGGTVLSASILESLAMKIGAGFIQQARAEALTGQADPRFLLNIWINGGPMRYSFDQWVKIYDGDNIVANPYVSTAFNFSGGKVAGLAYKTFKYNGLNVPHIFSLPIKNGQGGSRNASDALNNMLVMRGFGSAFDGHDTNALLVQVPVSGLPSLNGLLADSSERLFAGVMTGNNNVGFTSSHNKAGTQVGGGYVRELMAGFAQSSTIATTTAGKEAYKNAYENAMSYLKAYARSNRLGADTLNKNLENASAKMKQGISDIDGFWDAAVNRYKNAVEGTARMSGVSGISEAPVTPSSLAGPAGQFGIFGFVNSGGFNLQRNFTLAPDFDMREMTSALTYNDFYQQLALAEYCLTKELTASVSVGTSNFNNVRIRTSYIAGDDVNNLFVNGGNLAFSHTDMDGNTGAYTALLLTHNFYSGILAGILEMRDRLQTVRRASTGANMWSESVIQVSAEFARNAAISGQSSGHGYPCMVTSAFSGAIKNGPYVIGNLRQNAGNGTNGYGAAISGYLSGVPSTASATSTLSRLMRIESNPWENTAPAMISFNESTGVITSLVGMPKVV
ncbi:hypothetical protein ACLSU7_18350 [Bdellovibrio sp. HCB185ZH]|uniref:hypothetical protein n=1 Tax=Bdellovibrio sp. HCB185ZH TaxID=3394235 RepID=UPI0039A77F7B